MARARSAGALEERASEVRADRRSGRRLRVGAVAIDLDDPPRGTDPESERICSMLLRWACEMELADAVDVSGGADRGAVRRSGDLEDDRRSGRDVEERSSIRDGAHRRR